MYQNEVVKGHRYGGLSRGANAGAKFWFLGTRSMIVILRLFVHMEVAGSHVVNKYKIRHFTLPNPLTP